MSNDLTEVILDLQTRLAKLEAGARTSQLQHASLTGTAITVYDEDGETPLQYIGKQGDGTVGTVAVNGPVPPAPSLPTLTPGQLSLTVSWDGTFVDADGDPVPRPTDVEGVQVHVSDTSAFEPSSATLRGVLSVAGDLVVQPLVIEPKYVVLVAVTSSKVTGDPSAEATATPQDVVPGDGTITETKIEDGAITTPKLAANAVEADKIAANAVTAGKIDAGAVAAENLTADAIDGKTITGAVIRSGSSGGGVFVYDGEPTLGNLIISEAPTAGIDDFGNEYPKGFNVADGTISGAKISIEPGDQGVFVYSTVPTVETFATPGAGTWVAPAGVTSVKVECWGGGGGGGSVVGPGISNRSGGGGGGEYAAEVVSVTPGNSYAYVVGAGGHYGNGGNSTFGGTTVVAHGGLVGGDALVSGNGAGGAGGSGSTNTVHFDGGAGGTGSTGASTNAGGGSSAGPASAGNAGTSSAAGAAVPGGGAGGLLRDGKSPGGGGGGGGLAGGYFGAPGMVRITVNATRVLVASFAADNGTDDYGNTYRKFLEINQGLIGAGAYTVVDDDGISTTGSLEVGADLTVTGGLTTGAVTSSGAVAASSATFTSTTDANESAGNAPALRIGDVAGTHLRIDGNEIVAMASDTAAGTLFVNVLTAGKLRGDNIAGGSVFITPVANTPTSTTITGLGLPSGLSYVPQVSGNSASTAFQWVTASAPSENGLTITLLRSNTTSTAVYWTLIGV